METDYPLHQEPSTHSLDQSASRLGHDPFIYSVFRAIHSSSVFVTLSCPSSLLQSLKFFNCEMYYTDDELEALRCSLAMIDVEEREAFFKVCLMGRRRERQVIAELTRTRARLN